MNGRPSAPEAFNSGHKRAKRCGLTLLPLEMTERSRRVPEQRDQEEIGEPERRIEQPGVEQAGSAKHGRNRKRPGQGGAFCFSSITSLVRARRITAIQ